MKKLLNAVFIIFTCLFLYTNIAYSQNIKITKLDLGKKKEIFVKLKICEKVELIEDKYRKPAKDIACLYKNKEGEICRKYIVAAAEGSFSAENSQEMIIDIFDDCIPHAGFFGEMLLVRDFKIIQKFDRLGEGMKFFASVNTKSNKSLLLYISGYMFQGQGAEYLGLCKFDKSGNSIGANCKHLIEGDIDLSGRGSTEDFSIKVMDIRDLNGDGLYDLVVKIEKENNNRKKEKIIKLIFDGEKFQIK